MVKKLRQKVEWTPVPRGTSIVGGVGGTGIDGTRSGAEGVAGEGRL